MRYVYRDTTVEWTPEKLAAWVKERQDGVQYVTPYGPVYAPSEESFGSKVLKRNER